MRSYVDYKTNLLTETIDYLDHKEALKAHLEILRLQLLETVKLPNLYAESIFDESEFKNFRTEDHKYNKRIIDSVINFAVDNLYDELINEVDVAAPEAATHNPKAAHAAIVQLRDKLIAKIRGLMDSLMKTTTGAIQAGRSTTGADPDMNDPQLGATLDDDGTGGSAGAGAPMNGPSDGSVPGWPKGTSSWASPAGGGSAGAGAPMNGPSGGAPSGHHGGHTHAGPGGRSPMDTRPAWGQPRDHEYEGGFRPADYGSFRPSDGWWGGLRRTVVDPIMNSRPVKWLRRKWHGDPQREGVNALEKLFTENSLAIADEFQKAEKQLIKWVTDDIFQIAQTMGVDIGKVAAVADPIQAATDVNAPVTAGVDVPVTTGEEGGDDQQAAANAGSVGDLQRQAAQGNQVAKTRAENIRAAFGDLKYNYTGDDENLDPRYQKSSALHKKGDPREHIASIMHLVQGEDGKTLQDTHQNEGPALHHLEEILYEKVFGKPLRMTMKDPVTGEEKKGKAARNGVSKLYKELNVQTEGKTLRHRMMELLAKYGEHLHKAGTAPSGLEVKGDHKPHNPAPEPYSNGVAGAGGIGKPVGENPAVDEKDIEDQRAWTSELKGILASVPEDIRAKIFSRSKEEIVADCGRMFSDGMTAKQAAAELISVARGKKEDDNPIKVDNGVDAPVDTGATPPEQAVATDTGMAPPEEAPATGMAPPEEAPATGMAPPEEVEDDPRNRQNVFAPPADASSQEAPSDQGVEQPSAEPEDTRPIEDRIKDFRNNFRAETSDMEHDDFMHHAYVQLAQLGVQGLDPQAFEEKVAQRANKKMKELEFERANDPEVEVPEIDDIARSVATNMVANAFKKQQEKVDMEREDAANKSALNKVPDRWKKVIGNESFQQKVNRFKMLLREQQTAESSTQKLRQKLLLN